MLHSTVIDDAKPRDTLDVNSQELWSIMDDLMDQVPLLLMLELLSSAMTSARYNHR